MWEMYLLLILRWCILLLKTHFTKKLSLTSHIHKPNEVSAHQILVLFVEDISCADPIFNYYQMQPNGREFNLNPYPKSRGKRD